jgi:hypothetical protein
MVAREGIELAAKTLRFLAFHGRLQHSYPRCYPHLILANRQLNRGHLWGMNLGRVSAHRCFECSETILPFFRKRQ